MFRYGFVIMHWSGQDTILLEREETLSLDFKKPDSREISVLELPTILSFTRAEITFAAHNDYAIGKRDLLRAIERCDEMCAIVQRVDQPKGEDYTIIKVIVRIRSTKKARGVVPQDQANKIAEQVLLLARLNLSHGPSVPAWPGCHVRQADQRTPSR